MVNLYECISLQKIYSTYFYSVPYFNFDCCTLVYYYFIEKASDPDKTSSSEYRHDLTPSEYYKRYVKKWTTNETVRIVGGCCGIFPEHIQYLSSEITKQQN